MPGDLTLRGKAVRIGGQFSTAEAQVFDAQGKLLAAAAAPISPRRRRCETADLAERGLLADRGFMIQNGSRRHSGLRLARAPNDGCLH